jgi:DegV family protein with EDD domain
MDPMPTTAAPSSGEFQQLYASLIEQGFDHILSIHCSSTLSGIYNAASIAAQAVGTRVQVIDSQSLTLGLGFQALAAAEAAVSQSLESILNMLHGLRPRVHVIAMLDTLEYVRRSGRVSWARARIGNLLNLKAFIEVTEGKVLSLGEGRTRQKSIARLMELVRKLGPLERLAILHSNAENDARQMLSELNPQLPMEPLIVNVTTVIGVHVGPNGLGVAAVVNG